MYDPVAKDFGGKAEALAAAKGVQAQLEANNLKITRFDLVKPVRFVKSPVRQYVIVKTILEMEAPKVTMRSHGYQFGIEVSVGEWQFLDGSKLNKDIMAKYFPDFPKNEKLPELRKEML